MSAPIKAPARAALYTPEGSTLVTCAHHAERIGLRVVTMIEEGRPVVGLAGTRLNGLVGRLGHGEFEVIVADAGDGRLVTIAAVPEDEAEAEDEAVRCAIYVRCATSSQATPYPLADQCGACEAYADQQGWETVAVYKDNAVSGMTWSRPSLDAMIEEAERGTFDVVLVEDLDRLSRDVSHVHRLLDELEALGVAVHTVVGGTITDLEVAIRSTMKESSGEAAAAKVRRGRRQAGLEAGS